MATTTRETVERELKFNALAKVIGIMFGPDSLDCCFQFTDNGRIVKINCHKRLLSLLSPVFAVMFNGSWNDDSKPIPIVDASSEAFRTFLRYFYNGTINVNTENIVEIVYLAHKYDVQDAVVSCTSFMMDHLSIENVVSYYCMALLYDQVLLVSKCAELIKMNMVNILKSDDLIQCDHDALKGILELRPVIRDEHDVFDACIKWATNECQKIDINNPTSYHLRNRLGDCLELIRFKEMDRKEFGKRVEMIESMLAKDEFEDVVNHLLLAECDGIKTSLQMGGPTNGRNRVHRGVAAVVSRGYYIQDLDPDLYPDLDLEPDLDPDLGLDLEPDLDPDLGLDLEPDFDLFGDEDLDGASYDYEENYDGPNDRDYCCNDDEEDWC